MNTKCKRCDKQLDRKDDTYFVDISIRTHSYTTEYYSTYEIGEHLCNNCFNIVVDKIKDILVSEISRELF